eukprot:TRINITY_DN11173_c0_g1_i4.p2 TRINITY_DN11173_c0_g1~~TRINITY_DN11173_c0_g1_i4.p2  ORF type:complete len:132 (+),score=57.02 TRINITY_DN11173_c0_g1_i4:369-764(+)
MRESKGPSINLKNINFINKVEDYERRRFRRDLHIASKIDELTKHKLATNDYINKHSYMMHGNMMKSFEKAQIPSEDKRTVELAFNDELRSLKCELKELKEARKSLFAESNKIYFEIERINDELQVSFVVNW